MNDDQTSAPAVIPTLALIAGIAAAAELRAQPLTLVGLGVAALLVAVLHRRHAALLLTSALLLVWGVDRASDVAMLRRGVDEFVALHAEEAVELRGALRTAWSEVAPGRWRAVTRDAIVQHRRTRLAPSEDVALYVTSDVRPTTSERVGAIGVLRRSASGALALSVKSELLLENRGDAPLLDAREWNRRLTLRLQRFADRDADVARAVVLVRAVAFGDSSALDHQTRRAYREGGTYHLLVFSGMQIAFAAAAITFLLRPLRRPRLTDWTLLFAAAAAPLFAGPEPSVVRASLMVGAYAFSRLLGRPTTLRNLLFVSATIRLLLVPSDLFDGGFQLTYAAAAGVTIVGEAIASFVDPSRPLLRSFARLCGAELAIAPLTAFYFRRVILGGIVITLVASPFVSAMLAASVALSGAALFIPSLVRPIALLINLCNDAVLTINDVAASSLHIALLRPRPSALFLALVATAFVVASLTRYRRSSLAALAFLHLFLLTHRGATTSPFVVRALDVGQGDAILLRSGANNVLVDGGGRSEDDSFGDRVLVPQLVDRGVVRLDVVALTHAHPDHCGGLEAVLRALDVRELWLSGRQWREECSEKLFAAAVERRVRVRVVEHETLRRVGSMSFRIITPRLRFKRSPLNNGSTVFRVLNGVTSALLTGDIEKDAERLLVEEGGDLRSDILKVGHHGSRTSSTDLLLDAVQPRVALISCGVANRYGHPNSEVLERLAARHVRVLRTDLAGASAFRVEQAHLFAEREFDTPRSGH